MVRLSTSHDCFTRDGVIHHCPDLIVLSVCCPVVLWRLVCSTDRQPGIDNEGWSALYITGIHCDCPSLSTIAVIINCFSALSSDCARYPQGVRRELEKALKQLSEYCNRFDLPCETEVRFRDVASRDSKLCFSGLLRRISQGLFDSFCK